MPPFLKRRAIERSRRDQQLILMTGDPSTGDYWCTGPCSSCWMDVTLRCAVVTRFSGSEETTPRCRCCIIPLAHPQVDRSGIRREHANHKTDPTEVDSCAPESAGRNRRADCGESVPHPPIIRESGNRPANPNGAYLLDPAAEVVHSDQRWGFYHIEADQVPPEHSVCPLPRIDRHVGGALCLQCIQ